MKDDSFVSIITVTLDRDSLKDACESVDRQIFRQWHHYVLGDGVLPRNYDSPQRSTLGFSKVMGITEPGANMPNGTPNPMLRWALQSLNLGRYVCFLDDDNLYKPEYLEKMVHALDNNPDVGMVLCGAEDLRYFQDIDGYPEAGHCDNSAFMARTGLASSIEFPHAFMGKNVEQDVEYIRLCVEQGGYVRIPEKLLIFGSGVNLPPKRGKHLFLESWKTPQEAYYLAYGGNLIKSTEMLRSALRLNQFDAWSAWKLFEIGSLMGNRDSARQMLDLWETMYLESGTTHYYNEFSYAVLLRYTGRPYREVLRSAEEKLANLMKIEDSAAEHFYTMAVFCLFAGRVDEYTENLSKALRLNPGENFWAFRDAAWQFRIFACIFLELTDAEERFLQDVMRLR
jgi:glycosyltransferase involved in cell wall biosynthesis